ncbi:MAG: acyl carrier protein [Oleiphilaceae bacterium]|jgi:acyl carrier protein
MDISMSKILELVLETVKEVGEDQENQKLIDVTEETLLFSDNLDSLGIVFLITDLEAKITEELNIDIILADERAMSRRTSPFRSVKTLTEYAQKLIDEATIEQ